MSSLQRKTRKRNGDFYVKSAKELKIQLLKNAIKSHKISIRKLEISGFRDFKAYIKRRNDLEIEMEKIKRELEQLESEKVLFT